jgi:hypothetical protein
MNIFHKIKPKVGAVLITAVLTPPLASPSSLAEVPQNQIVAHRDRVTVHNDENSASISFPRPSGGVTQIGVEHLDFSPSAYVTTVTACGPTIDDAAIVAASVQTFTNLDQQTLFADAGSITFAYSQAKPSYVISELERAKLISPVEAQAARTAFYSLQTRVNPKPAPGVLESSQ